MQGRGRESIQTGVTLVELMVVMVIVAIIAAIAVPSYRNYILRSQRTDATAALLRVRAAQEKFYLQNRRYADDFGPAGLNMNPAAGVPLTTEHGFYQISIATPEPGNPAPSFQATAVPVGAQTEDESCRSFTLNDQGVKGALDAGGTDRSRECWR